jgi:hypothetical protein
MTTSLARRWPALAGLAFAALVAFDLVAGVELAAVLAASAMIYLGAAALGRPRAAWPLFFATIVVITVVKVVDGGIDATWIVLGVGVILAAYGLVRGAIRPAYALPLQSLALLGFGAAAGLALLIDPVIGGYLVALGLLGHAAWDFYHHRTGRVVARSLAEFCLVLDTALAVVIVIVTATA